MTSTGSGKLLRLQGKRVLVTGAGRGIGRAIALICHEEGAHVAIASRTESELRETFQLASKQQATIQNDGSECENDASSRMSLHVADVTNPSQVESMIREIRQTWTKETEKESIGLDILINNAGGAQKLKGPVDSLEVAALNNILQLNVVGTHIVTSAVLKSGMMSHYSSIESETEMKSEGGCGCILNISSKAGKVGLENYSFYVASKFALEGMTSSWAKELKSKSIAVHSISPGMVDTKSFPKPAGKKGVRPASSISDGLLMALTAGLDYTGHYLHVDELDMVRQKGLPDTTAWKPIDEPNFKDTL